MYPKGYTCNKQSFNLLLRILSDAQRVSFYYSELLFQDSLPISLSEYKNYRKESEEYFNLTRLQKVPELDMSYHDFYIQLLYLKTQYEKPNNNDRIRRSIILKVFEHAFIVQRSLVIDLYNLCNTSSSIFNPFGLF